MNRIVVFFGLFALMVAAQPVFMASAGTKLYVEQEGSEDSKDEDGGFRLYNTVPTTNDYTVPLSNKLASSQARPKTVRGIPDTWRVLDKNVIQNRVDDTKSALALAAKLRAKITQPEPWPKAVKKQNQNTASSLVTNDRQAEKNQKKVEKDMEKRKKEADKIAKKKAEEDQKRKAEEDKKKEAATSSPPGGETTEKSNSLKRKNRETEGESRRVFNLPD